MCKEIHIDSSSLKIKEKAAAQTPPRTLEEKSRRRENKKMNDLFVLFLAMFVLLLNIRVNEAFPVPDESDNECRERVSRYWIKRDVPDTSTARGRVEARGGFVSGPGTTYNAEYCSLCTRASVEQVQQGYIQSGCRYVQDLHNPRGMDCIPKPSFLGMRVSRIVPTSGQKDEYQCMKMFGECNEDRIASQKLTIDTGHGDSESRHARSPRSEEHIQRLRDMFYNNKFKKPGQSGTSSNTATTTTTAKDNDVVERNYLRERIHHKKKEIPGQRMAQNILGPGHSGTFHHGSKTRKDRDKSVYEFP